MAAHGSKRTRPAELVPGTLRVISVRMDYLPDAASTNEILNDPAQAFVSRYAVGRDYHKVLRKRLQRLAERIEAEVGPYGYRAFVDSAPVMEKALAEKAGLGWIGKHTNLINRDAGSWFFLGELYTDLPLPVDEPVSEHCGDCTACIAACPTDAIVAPYQLDARRCISYLTIELKDSIPEPFRVAIGNRIYGCDDCLAVCPWNKFAVEAREIGYATRADLAAPRLADLAVLDDAAFREMFRGSPIKRIGRDRFVRNVLYAIGNSGRADLAPVAARLTGDPDPAVADAAAWASARLSSNR
jgi:epoxyqueuosine reductase